VTNFGDGTVSVITTASGAVSAPITVGPAPHGAAITPDGKRVYVVNSGDGTVSAITTATGAVSAPITVGGNPSDVRITPDGKRALVTNRNDGTVSVITTATGAVAAPVTVGQGPIRVAICPPASALRPRSSDAHSAERHIGAAPATRLCADDGGYLFAEVAALPAADARRVVNELSLATKALIRSAVIASASAGAAPTLPDATTLAGLLGRLGTGDARAIVSGLSAADRAAVDAAPVLLQAAC
jgi:YVTN family beta-propeller protein